MRLVECSPILGYVVITENDKDFTVYVAERGELARLILDEMQYTVPPDGSVTFLFDEDEMIDRADSEELREIIDSIAFQNAVKNEKYSLN